MVGTNHYFVCVTACSGGSTFQGVDVETLLATSRSPLNYATYGLWAKEDYTNAATTGFDAVTTGVFATGVITTTMPTTGTATYSGGVTGAEYTGTTSGGRPTNTFTGNVALTADFAANSITGSMTGLTASSFTSGRSAGSMNDTRSPAERSVARLSRAPQQRWRLSPERRSTSPAQPDNSAASSTDRVRLKRQEPWRLPAAA